MERAPQSRKRHPLEATYRTTVEGLALHGGPWQTCYDYFVRWRRDGTWDRLLAHVQTKADAVGEVEWEVRAWTTRSCGLTSTHKAESQRCKEGVWPLVRGSARKKPWKPFYQGPSRLRWQRQATFSGSHARTKTLKHPTWKCARGHSGTTSFGYRQATQAPGSSHRRQRV